MPTRQGRSNYQVSLMGAAEFHLLFSELLIAFSFRLARRENGSFIDDCDGSLGVMEFLFR